MEIIRRQLAVTEMHELLAEALDTAIAVEKELGKQLYAIEDLKKNTLTSADYQHGDNANFGSIIESANVAKAKAVSKPNAFANIASDRMAQLEALTSQAMIGRGLISMVDNIEYDFTEAETEKIDELRDLIEENKQADAEFTAKIPYDVEDTKYCDAMDANMNGATVEDDLDEPDFG